MMVSKFIKLKLAAEVFICERNKLILEEVFNLLSCIRCSVLNWFEVRDE